jgi:hypothetical protein
MLSKIMNFGKVSHLFGSTSTVKITIYYLLSEKRISYGLECKKYKVTNKNLT